LRAEPALALADVAYTLRVGRAALPVRGYIVAGTAAAAADALEVLAAGGLPNPDRTARAAAAPDGDGAALRALGERWAHGEDVAWPSPAPGTRRVRLPTYPFGGDAYGSFSLAEPRARDPRPSADVTELLSASLGLTGPADLDRTYFGAGGDSLTAVNLIGRIRDEFGIDVPVEIFFEDLTLSELADRITTADNGTLLESFLDEIEN
jgi:acyl transferase domain-containing protein